MVRVRINRTYSFLDKDPVIKEVGKFIAERGLTDEFSKLGTLSTLSPSTIKGWYKGRTRRPQHCSVASVVTALGGRFGIIADKKKSFELDAELATARKWIKANKPRKPRKRKAKKK